MSKRNQSPTPRETLKEGDKIGQYEILALLGQGGYGDIYLVQLSNKHEKYALKCESLKSPKQGLSVEHSFLIMLQDSKCFPLLYDYGKTTQYRFLVMEVLGPSLSNMRRKLPHRHYSLSTALRLAVYMTRAIQQFHYRGFVHRDIKPGNFLLRPESRNPITLIDFGLSRRFINPDTKFPFKERPKAGFRGTSKYASLTAHENHDLARKDDLISLIYSLVEMVRGRLPWSDKKELADIYKQKKAMPPEELFINLPDCFLEVWNHVNSLLYEDEPNYEFIIHRFLDEIGDQEILNPSPFDWETLDEEEMHEFSPYVPLPKAKSTSIVPTSEYNDFGKTICCSSQLCLLL